MSRKPEKEENIAVTQSQKFSKPEGVFRSLKDVCAERQKLAEAEGVTFTTRHFLAVPLLEDGAKPEKAALVDDWKRSR